MISSTPSESGISIALAFLVLRLEGAREEGTDDWGVATFEAAPGMSLRANLRLSSMGDLHGVRFEAETLNERPRGAILAASRRKRPGDKDIEHKGG